MKIASAKGVAMLAAMILVGMTLTPFVRSFGGGKGFV